jgi:chemotaxis protein CheD
VLNGPDTFRIGERNSAAVKTWLASQGLRVDSSDLGGTLNRTLHLELATGCLTMKLPDRSDKISMA